MFKLAPGPFYGLAAHPLLDSVPQDFVQLAARPATKAAPSIVLAGLLVLLPVEQVLPGAGSPGLRGPTGYSAQTQGQ